MEKLPQKSPRSPGRWPVSTRDSSLLSLPFTERQHRPQGGKARTQVTQQEGRGGLSRGPRGKRAALSIQEAGLGAGLGALVEDDWSHPTETGGNRGDGDSRKLFLPQPQQEG